jgi:hypothetical protein
VCEIVAFDKSRFIIKIFRARSSGASEFLILRRKRINIKKKLFSPEIFLWRAERSLEAV